MSSIDSHGSGEASQSFLSAPFPHRKAGHCGSGALRDLLEFHDRHFGRGPLSEGFVFGVAGGLGFLFFAAPASRPPIYLVGRTADLERDIASHLGIPLEVRQTDDPSEGWQWVKDEVEAGRPPMVWADIGRLEYLRVRMHNTRHDIVVVGYDEAKGTALVADNDREQLQECSLESLSAARNSDAFPGPNRHTTFIYDFDAPIREAREAVRAAIARAVANMAGDGGDALVGTGAHSGLRGIESFVDSYAGWPEAFGEELGAAMRALHVFIVKAGTGGAMFRSLHATFLHDAANLIEDPELTELGRVYDELAAHWIALAGLATRPDLVTAHGDGRPLVELIQRLEREGVARMAEWIESTA